MVSARAATSPFACTVRRWLRSPLATAVTTLTIPRTWSVKLEAMKLTLSVRSFQVPATLGTTAWPPSLPSVPTSHATDLAGKRIELVDHGVDHVLQLQDLALDVYRDFAVEVAARHRRGDVGDVTHLCREVAAPGVDVVGQVLPCPLPRPERLPARRAGPRCRPREPRG